MHRILLQNADGTIGEIEYDSENNMLSSGGQYLTEQREPLVADFVPHMRIFLGTSCNFDCSYCKEKVPTKKEEAKFDLEKILAAIPETITSVSFWGGEPLLKQDKIAAIIKELRKRRVFAIPTPGQFNLFSNGRLLGKRSVLDFLLEEKIFVSLSHDGPAQRAARGREVLDDLNVKRGVEELLNASLLNFTPTINNLNYDLKAYAEYIRERISVPFQIGCAMPMEITDNEAAEFAVPEEDLATYGRKLWLAVASGSVPEYVGYHNVVNGFLQNLGNSHYAPFCTFTGDMLAIDAAGDRILCTCFADKRDGFDRNSILESFRPNCKGCVVNRFCNGGCPFNEKKEENCKQMYYFYLHMLGAAMQQITGALLREVPTWEQSCGSGATDKD